MTQATTARDPGALGPVPTPFMVDSPYVRRAPRPSPAVPLVCFPRAGAGASAYNAWPDLLPPWVEVLALQLPGRQDRMAEPQFTRAAPLTAVLRQVLRPYAHRTPLAFFGHSAGALLAFEVARAMTADGAAVSAHLFVGSRLSGSDAPWRGGTPELAVVEDLAGSAKPGVPVPPDPDAAVINLLTSGSTGMPKCVRMRNRQIVAGTRGAIAALGLTGDEVVLRRCATGARRAAHRGVSPRERPAGAAVGGPVRTAAVPADVGLLRDGIAPCPRVMSNSRRKSCRTSRTPVQPAHCW